VRGRKGKKVRKELPPISLRATRIRYEFTAK
jgi:hypothetical protein